MTKGSKTKMNSNWTLYWHEYIL